MYTEHELIMLELSDAIDMGCDAGTGHSLTGEVERYFMKQRFRESHSPQKTNLTQNRGDIGDCNNLRKRKF